MGPTREYDSGVLACWLSTAPTPGLCPHLPAVVNKLTWSGSDPGPLWPWPRPRSGPTHSGPAPATHDSL